MSIDPHGNVHLVESDEEFNALIESSGDNLVAVDFSAEWCGPCKQIAPLYISLSVQYNDTIFLKVDVDRLQETARKYDVRAMPTFMFFRNGQKVHEFRGANAALLQTTLQDLTKSNTGAQTAKPAQPSTPSAPSVRFTFFPQESYIYFDTGKVEQISDKIISVNASKFASDEALKSHYLSPTEIQHLQKLSQTIKNSSQYHVSKFTPEEFAVIHKLIHWPLADRFPALDLLRLMAIHPEAASFFGRNSTVNTLLQNLKEKNAPFANYLMTLRFLANAFRFEALRKSLVANFDSILDCLVDLKSHDNRNVRITLDTLLMNFSILCTTSPEEVQKSKDLTRKALPIVFESLKNESDEEGQLRLIVTLGTFLLNKQESELKAEVAKNSDYITILSVLKPASQKIGEAMKELALIMNGQVPAATKPALSQPQQPIPSFNPSTTASNNPLGDLGSMMGGFPPGMVPNDLVQRAMTNPRIMQAMQNPAILARLQQVFSNPGGMADIQNDPELMELIQLFSSVMQ